MNQFFIISMCCLLLNCTNRERINSPIDDNMVIDENLSNEITHYVDAGISGNNHNFEETQNLVFSDILESFHNVLCDILCSLCGHTINDGIHVFVKNEHMEIGPKASSPWDPLYFHINNIPEQFFGVYLPINFIKFLQKTKNFSLAMNQNWDGGRSDYHDLLIVTKNRIASNAGFHDGYAISARDAEYFKFIVCYQYHNNYSQRIIIDGNGFQYKKISQNTENAFDVIANFIGEVIFSEAIERDKVELRGNNVYIIELNREFRIHLSTFIVGDPNLTLVGDRELLFLEIIDGRYIFYNTIRYCAMSSQRGDIIVFEFLFFARGKTAYNKRYTLRRLFGGSGLRKTAVGLRPLCGFLSATFWAGVNATHCPITCPKRRIPGTLYEMWAN